MRIATFNVNSIKARLAFVLHWLEARKPDIACLQELKMADDKFPYEVFKEAGYHAYVHGQKSWNGVAVLSRFEGEVVQAGLPHMTSAGSRLITVRFAQHDLNVTSVYVPNGKTVTHSDFDMKLEWLRQLRNYLHDTMDASGRAVVGGDFNVVHQDVDSHAPEKLKDRIFHTKGERGVVNALLDLGLVDLYRAVNPDGTMFSWWDYRAGAFHKNHGLRIDLLLATKSIAEQAGQVWIDRDYRKKKDGETASDHAPVIAELDG